MSAQQNTRLGIFYMVSVTIIFALQDALSRHLAGSYNVWMIVTIRFWFLSIIVTSVAAHLGKKNGGIKPVIRSTKIKTQIIRGLLLITQISIMQTSFVLLGLIQSHAVFATSPLIIAALSGPFLGEKVGWRRWSAIAIGFIGMLIILEPGRGIFSPLAFIPLAGAGVFALYSLLTRHVSQSDNALTSLFWASVVGTTAISAIGIWHWQEMALYDWGFMLILCVAASASHWLLIRAYEIAEASALQPFSYLQLVWAAILGMAFFNETLKMNVAIGSGIVVLAGLFTLWRQRKQQSTDH